MLTVVIVCAFCLAAFMPVDVLAKGGPKARDIIEENRAAAAAKEQEVEDYDFVVIEDEEVPLAMAPEKPKKIAPVIWTVVCCLLVITGTVHIIAFAKYKERIKVIEKDISKEERESLNECSLMFRPKKRAELAEEIENELASRYLDD